MEAMEALEVATPTPTPTLPLPRVLTDVHSCPVAHLRFLHPSRPHVLSADARGAAHLLSFSRLLLAHTVHRQCLP